MIKDVNPTAKIGFIGAKVAVEPEKAFTETSAIDFVARNEFDFTIKEVAEGRDLGRIAYEAFMAGPPPVMGGTHIAWAKLGHEHRERWRVAAIAAADPASAKTPTAGGARRPTGRSTS